MTRATALKLAKGSTTHYRSAPFRRAFSYPVRMIDIDIDQLSKASEMSTLFSIDRFNAMSLDTRSRGDRGMKGLKDWALERFRSAGIETVGHTIRLITFPSTLGYSFSPLSLWLLISEANQLTGMIYEVNNTFGDDHSYVARATEGSERHLANKEFYVSPFFDVSGKYRFTLTYTSDHLKLLIDNLIDGERVHSATLDLKLEVATATSLSRFSIGSVFSGIAVILRIHWQALKLWMRGARYHSRKSKTRNGITLANGVSGAPNHRTEGAL